MKNIETEIRKGKKLSLIFWILSICLILYGFVLTSCANTDSNPAGFEVPEGKIALSFSVVADIRNFARDNKSYFRSICERIASGGRGDFMISPGDIDPPDLVFKTIKRYIGIDYVWFPVVGNHDLDETSIEWLQGYMDGNFFPVIVETGPRGGEKTTYSFSYGSVHFIVLNEYYDGGSPVGTDGNVVEPLYRWLKDDLSTNLQTEERAAIFVFGHEPAYPQPDEESGRLRHESDSLNKYVSNRDRFWKLLSDFHVSAYVCGHTHNFSAVKIDGVWQIDAGHGRGWGDVGSRSTFLMFYIMDTGDVWVYVYRLSFGTGKYELTRKIMID